MKHFYSDRRELCANLCAPGLRWQALPARLAAVAATLGVALLTAGPARAQTTNFPYTGTVQTYTVPANTTRLNVTADGAAGSTYGAFNNFSVGGRVVATVAVTPGEVLTVVVGGFPSNYNTSGTLAGGYNGGGGSTIDGAGGGATDLRRATAAGATGDYLSSRNALLVAGGGGGSSNGYSSNNNTGGSGGNPNGGNGTGSAAYQGYGATQAGPGTGFSAGFNGVNNTGGTGRSGGGGGYYGGGGSSRAIFSTGSPSAGGGSSWVMPGSTSVSYGTVPGAASGFMTITALASPSVTTATATGITSVRAVLGGEVTAAGGSALINRGVVFSTTDNTPTIGEPGVTQDNNSPANPGTFSETIGGLTGSTTYYVRAFASNSYGTSYGSTVSFTTLATLSASTAQSNVSCNGGANGAAAVSVSGGVSPYTYSWSPSGGTAASATGLSAGSYTVTINDAGGASITRSFVITQPSAALSASSVTTNVSCFGGSNGAINVSVSGGTAPYTYSWDGGSITTKDRTGLSAGTYTVTVADANGCLFSTSATITQPNSTVSGTTVVTNVACNGGATGAINLTPRGGTGPYTYNWGSITTEDRTGLAAGNYSVTITDANGCTGIVTASVTQPSAPGVSAVVQNIACFGGTGSINLTPTGGTAPYTYDWGGGVTTEDRTNLVAGTYSVTIIDANGCQITRSYTVNQPTALTTTGSQTNVTSFGGADGTATVTASGGEPFTGYFYSWARTSAPAGSIGQNTPTITGLSAGTYRVTVTDANSCTTTRDYTIAQPAAPTAAPVLTTPTNGLSLNTTTPTYAGTAVAGSTVTVYVDGSSTGTTTANASGNWTLTQPTALAQGSHTVYATAQSSGQTVSGNSNTNTFTVDSVRPTVAISSSAGASGGTTGTSPIPFTVTFSEAVTGFVIGDVTVTGGTLGSVSGSGTTYTFNVTPTTPGSATVVSVPGNVAFDAASNGNTAATAYSLTYTIPTSLTCLTANNALNFNGTNDHVRGTAALPAMTAMTLEGWVYQEANSNFRTLLNGDNFPAGAVHIHMTNGTMQFTVNGSSPADYFASASVPLNTWAHVAVVYTSTGGAGGTVKFYLNGAPLNTITASSTRAIVSQNYSVGAWFDGAPQRFFDGSLNELRVWNVARTDAQIAANYQAQLPAQAGLIARYSFNQGTAGAANPTQTTLADDSGSGRTGTLTGFALTAGSQSNYVAGNSLNETLTLASFAPTSGVVGQLITLTGTGFTGATGVSFNGTAATSFTVVSSTTIRAIVPAGTTSGTLLVTTACGTVTNTSPFTVCAAPVAIAQNTSVTLDASGSATITAAAVNNGSTANCGPAAPGSLGLADATNRLANGTFDTNVTGWTIANVDGNGGYRASGGNPGGMFILNDAGNPSTDPTLSQVVSGLVSGTTYVLRGDYRSNYVLGTLGVPALAVDLDGTQLATFPAVGTTWTPFSLTFTATGPSQTLAFRGEINGTDVDIVVDNLRLSLVSSTLLYTCANVGANPVTLVVTDAGGNTTTAPATVTVNIPVTPTTTWRGSASTVWTDCANWSFGKVPDATTNVVIPTGLTSYPTLGSGTLAVQDLTIQGGASLTVSSGTTLQVNGHLTNNGTATFSGTVAFVGSAAIQTLSNNGGFTTVTVTKPSGTVQLGQNLTINSALTLTSGTLTTTGAYQVNLGNSATLSESETSYVLGRVVANRTLVPGTAQAFGGLGLTLTPAAGSVAPGATLVTRVTGTALTGTGTSVSIRRYFDIQPATNAGLNVTMDFAYFDHELSGIPAANLALFKSVTTTAGPWANQSPITQAPNQVTKTGIADFSIWTLGNSANPLPVELVAFTATVTGPQAVRLTWTTATEVNSAAFGVERSLDGVTFRTVGTVPAAGTSSAPRTYSLLDQQLPAGAAVLYYRLQQLDQDGTVSYSPVRVVSLSSAPSARLTLAPNPTTGAATLRGASAHAPVQLYDAVGRLVLTATADATGTARLVLPSGQPLGVYVVRTGAQAVRLVLE